jgi:hypothetical protein
LGSGVVIVDSDNEFHSLTARGRNENLYKSFDGCGGIKALE